MRHPTEMLTITEAARMLGRDPRTVRRWIDAGSLPGVAALEILGRRYVRRAVIEAILQRGSGPITSLCDGA